MAINSLFESLMRLKTHFSYTKLKKGGKNYGIGDGFLKQNRPVCCNKFQKTFKLYRPLLIKIYLDTFIKLKVLINYLN